MHNVKSLGRRVRRNQWIAVSGLAIAAGAQVYKALCYSPPSEIADSPVYVDRDYDKGRDYDEGPPLGEVEGEWVTVHNVRYSLNDFYPFDKTKPGQLSYQYDGDGKSRMVYVVKVNKVK